jgi:putative tricarboxylic transport membrane protein
MRKRISAQFTEINADSEFRKNMVEQGLELVDVPYEKMAAFMEERKKAYVPLAKLMGLIK